jgi:phosphoribosylaminoimidazole-succinocarboxamide synthase
MIPIEIRMHNLAANDLCDRFGIEQWKLLACPIIEFYFKNNSSNHHLINNFHIVAFKMATPDDIKIIERLTSKINAVLKSFFLRRQLQLVNFKLEFGRFNNKIMLGSALDFDTCKLIRASVSPTKDDFSDVGKKYEQLYQIILDK